MIRGDQPLSISAVRTLKPLLKFIPFAILALLATAPVAQAQRERLPPEDLEFVEKIWPDAKKTVTGIRYIVMHEGQGDTIKAGDKVDVLYVGRLLNGKIFDKAQEREKPFSFRVHRNEVIEGWDQVLQTMKKGEKRLVIIPPELAYGTRGQPPVIGRNATLVFEMEVIAVNGK